jgi:phosphatidate phosphatase LPIN
MACLRDIEALYKDRELTPFYAGFGNRITDALSYRSVGVPSSKIFTINTNSEVHMELLELAGFKSSYVLITELVDHFFPAVTELSSWQQGSEDFSDLNYWREPILAKDYEFSSDEDSDSHSPSKTRPLGGLTKTMTTASLSTVSDSEASDDYYDEDAGDEDDDDDGDEDDEGDYVDDLDHDLSFSQGDLSQSHYETSHEDAERDDEEDLDLLDSPAESPPPSRSAPPNASIVTATDALRDMNL